MASFVSAKDIEAAKVLKKQKKRKEREAILEQAKITHQKKKFREEHSEKNWMAPGLLSRFSEKKSSCSKIKREKKKKSGSKRSRKETERTNSSSSDSDGGNWVEKGINAGNTSKIAVETNTSTLESTIQRDSWMTAPPESSQSSLFATEKRQMKSAEYQSQKEVHV